MRKFRVVLVEPEHPHNVGFVARAMHCYALDELYIVYPRRNKVIENSYHTAPNSHEVLVWPRILRARNRRSERLHVPVRNPGAGAHES